MRPPALAFLTLLAATALPFSARTAEAPIDVLIVDGFSNHDWKLTTSLIRGILEPTGLFTVAVSTAPGTKEAPGWDAWRPKFGDYDVVIQTCNDINGGPPWPRSVQDDFEAFVREGGGVYVWHAGNNAFADWPVYNEMIGLGWRKRDFGWAVTVDVDGKIIRIPSGEGGDTGHGARLDTIVKRLGDHPIHAGLPSEWLTPDIEVYHYARGPAQNLKVLSFGYDPRTEMNWPLEWTVTYGEGRIYTSTFGHVWKGDTQPERMRCAGLQTVAVRALQWLARREVTWPVPADFPTADKTSVRGEIPLAAAAANKPSPPAGARANLSRRIVPDPAAKFLSWAPTPPMGWNSWDCFATTVTEAQTRAQADYDSVFDLLAGTISSNAGAATGSIAAAPRMPDRRPAAARVKIAISKPMGNVLKINCLKSP